jgi:hybrid cluster-associated redox disulfide protein
MTITKDHIIAEVLNFDRSLAVIFMQHGLHCLGCAAANNETIGEAAMVHGIDGDALLDALNAHLSNK